MCACISSTTVHSRPVCRCRSLARPGSDTGNKDFVYLHTRTSHATLGRYFHEFVVIHDKCYEHREADYLYGCQFPTLLMSFKRTGNGSDFCLTPTPMQ